MDSKAIADIIKENGKQARTSAQEIIILRFAIDFAEVLEKEHKENFNRTRFLHDCGVRK